MVETASSLYNHMMRDYHGLWFSEKDLFYIDRFNYKMLEKQFEDDDDYVEDDDFDDVDDVGDDGFDGFNDDDFIDDDVWAQMEAFAEFENIGFAEFDEDVLMERRQ